MQATKAIDQWVICTFLLPTLLTSPITAQATKDNLAVEIIRRFYKHHLDHVHSSRTDVRPGIRFSKAFSETFLKSAAICKQHQDIPCGWGADGDPYLDAQEIDPKLDYLNSRIQIKTIAHNTIQVKLNVYPSAKNAGSFYDRTILYKIIMEHGRPVVDDIIYRSGVSARKELIMEQVRYSNTIPQ